jgi:N-acetylmuramoyl-L-alanine amidase CwlA
MNIIQRLIPAKFTSTRPGVKMDPKYITIHETDNENAGANAEAHARLQENGNSRQASWHYQVDDTKIIQSVPDNEHVWAAGDGQGPGNLTSIHIEICVNKGGDFKKAVKNAAELTKYLMKKHSIGLSHVVQHNKWSGKDCPNHLRAGDWGVKWSDFTSQLKDDPKPAAKPAQAASKTFMIRVKVPDLWYYSKPNWKAKVALVHKNEVFTVVDTLTVDGAKMYKLKAGNYITASTKYVEVVK